MMSDIFDIKLQTAYKYKMQGHFHLKYVCKYAIYILCDTYVRYLFIKIFYWIRCREVQT